jgi:hypothetical protein
VGIHIPALVAASRIVDPSGAETSTSSIVNKGISVPQGQTMDSMKGIGKSALIFPSGIFFYGFTRLVLPILDDSIAGIGLTQRTSRTE